jgi:TRAP-type uncharacterized transport system substrate-binding protein
MAPESSTAELPRWARIALVVAIVTVAAGTGVLAYVYATRPVTLTVAAGSLDGEVVQLTSAIASRLASTNSQIRLKVVDVGNTLAASKALSDATVDLAIVRADAGDLSDARTVVLLTHAIVMIVVPPGSAIDSIDDLKDKTVGVVGGEVNRAAVTALSREFDLAQGKIRFHDLALADVPQAVRSKQVHALLMVTPVSEKYLSTIRSFFPRASKQTVGLIPIESAGAIAAVTRSYESYELPKGTLRGSPPVPDEDLTTLRVPVYLVAKKKLDSDRVTALTKAVMDVRRDLIAAYPLLAQIAAPSTDQDAFIPIHPGAAVYFGGDEKSFFDKYGDQLFYGSMLLGTLTSVLAAAWKFMGFAPPPKGRIPPLYSLAERIRNAGDEAELMAVEDEIDAILKAELARHGEGDADAAHAATLGLATHRLEYLLNRRRTVLREGPATHPAT